LLRVLDQQYAYTKNPVFVWAAIATALKRGAPLPAWVRHYLGRVAASIGTLSRTVPRKNDPPRAVYRALEFGRRVGGNPFTAMSDSWHTVRIALDVWRAMRRHAADVRSTPWCARIRIGARDPQCTTISEAPSRACGGAPRRHPRDH
jgi:hypothetical protein